MVKSLNVLFFFVGLAFSLFLSSLSYGCGLTFIEESVNEWWAVCTPDPAPVCEDLAVGSYVTVMTCEPQDQNPAYFKKVYTIYQVNDDPSDTCSNGEKDSDEEGIDCGGSCSSECVEACSGDHELRTGPDGFTTCYAITTPDAFGNCSSGTLSANGVECQRITFDYVAASQDYLDSLDEPLPDSETVEFASGAFSQTTFVSPETVVDNGDGTETATITKTTTSSNGSTSSSSTSVTRASGSSSGTGFTSDGGVASGYEGSTETDGDIPSEAVAGSAGTAEALNMEGVGAGGIAVIQQTISDFVNDVNETSLLSSFSGAFSLPSDSIGSSDFSLDFGSYGVHSVSADPSDVVYSYISQALAVCALVSGVYIIFRKA